MFRVTRPDYTGRPGPLFWLSFGQILLTIVTLGIGRFWMQTRLRRYYWSSLEIMGQPLEYTGSGLEKLFGFLIAVVILAAYLGLAQLSLAFIGLSYFQGNIISLQLSVLAILPLVFWAQYRARRYIMARTRWGGIRFGMVPGAWGYTVRAILWWIVTILSLGLLYPLLQMKLARYMTDRTYFGDMQFEQRGGWGPLFVSWLIVWASALVVVAFIVAMVALNEAEIQPDWFLSAKAWIQTPDAEYTLIFAAIAVTLWFSFQYTRHSVFTFRYLNSNRWLGANTWFETRLRVWTVIAIYIGGSIMIFVINLLVSIVAVIVMIILILIAGSNLPDVDSAMAGDFEAIFNSSALALTILLAALYFIIIAISVSLTQVFLIHPMIRATTDSFKIFNAEAAARANQRAHDDQVEAGGFADALGADFGGI